MYFFSIAMLHCTSNTHSRWVMKRTKKIKLKIFFSSSIYFALQSIIVYLNSYQSSIFSPVNCCLNPHLLVNWRRKKHEQYRSNNALLSTCTIENVFRRANNSNFQFSNRNVTFITEAKKIPFKASLSVEKKWIILLRGLFRLFTRYVLKSLFFFFVIIFIFCLDF
jgi:hypothetical protein